MLALFLQRAEGRGSDPDVTRNGNFTVGFTYMYVDVVCLQIVDFPSVGRFLVIMTEKKLQRSVTDKLVAGVCGGLGKYFEIDPIIVRLVFVLLALAGGPGVILYIILWVIMPEEGALGEPPAPPPAA